jgi:hypothetical protein
MNKYCLFLFLTVLGFTSCTNNSPSEAQLQKLEGTWVREFNGVQQVVTWQKSNQGYDAQNLYVNQNETVVMEESVLHTQTNFELTTTYPSTDIKELYTAEMDEDTLVLTNTQNQYPQQLKYQIKNADELDIVIIGSKNGVKQHHRFTYHRL